jgi:hypothetical protein
MSIDPSTLANKLIECFQLEGDDRQRAFPAAQCLLEAYEIDQKLLEEEEE